MKIEKRITNENIVQITTLDERWYEVDKGVFAPSVTWIAGYYPKGIGFMKWLASNGWNEAEAIKEEAGDKGSRVHRAIESLIKGDTLKMDGSITDEEGLNKEFTVEEWEAIMSFVDFWREHKPTPVDTEFVVTNKPLLYAGTVDLLCTINGETWIIDFKTSKTVYPSHEIQVSAYKHVIEASVGNENIKMGILQVGYKLNKRGWKLNEIEDKYDLFEATYAIWENENKDVTPKQKDYPVELSLTEGGESHE